MAKKFKQLKQERFNQKLFHLSRYERNHLWDTPPSILELERHIEEQFTKWRQTRPNIFEEMCEALAKAPPCEPSENDL